MTAVKTARSAVSLLIVEDDPEARRSMALIIAKKYPDLLLNTVGSGREGVAFYRANAPDIVITDINMPVMDGLQMAREIRSLTGDTRFIVLSGYSDGDHLDKANEIGASDYIVKPIHFQKLFAAIDKCLREIA